MIKIQAQTSVALRDLARLGALVKEYPVKRGKAQVNVLNQHKPELMADFKRRLIHNLHRIAPGFAWGTSRVEKHLKVIPGTGLGQRGVSGFQAVVEDPTSAMIARTWNSGVTIKPKKYKYLAEPLNNKDRYKLAVDYGDNYTTWVYKDYNRSSLVKAVKQEVAGLMVLRSKSSFIMERRFKQGKMRDSKVGRIEARFVLLKSQTIEATHWADKALQEFKQNFINKIPAIFAEAQAGKGLL